MPSTPLEAARRCDDQLPEELLEVTFIGEDDSLAELYRLKLELDGYWVTLAPSFGQGLELLHERTPDIAFLDLGPGSEAPVDVLGMLRRDPLLKNLPVVLLLRDSEGEATIDELHLTSRDFLVRVPGTPGQAMGPGDVTQARRAY